MSKSPCIPLTKGEGKRDSLGFCHLYLLKDPASLIIEFPLPLKKEEG
jgi:hypothetical protein